MPLPFPQNTLLGELPVDRKLKPFERIDWQGRNYIVRHATQFGARGLRLFEIVGTKQIEVAPVMMVSDIEALLGIPGVRVL